MPRLKKDDRTPEQIASAERYRRLHELAYKAGFDDDALAYSEFCLMPLFEIIVEECALIAEGQARVYSDGNSGMGALDAANAIRNYGKVLGNG